MVNKISLTIDEKAINVLEGTTLLQAAQLLDIEIPVLCHSPKLSPVGVCRTCVVEIEGRPNLAASCIRQCEPEMVIQTNSGRVRQSRKIVLEMLLADHPIPCDKHKDTRDCQLEILAEKEGIMKSRFDSFNHKFGRDSSSPVISVNFDACILCDRCIRACTEIQSNDVIGRISKGSLTRISFDDDLPMGNSSCVSCGECMAECPTGALFDIPLSKEKIFDEAEKIDSVCPYCGVGCAVTFHVKKNTIVRVSGLDNGPANLGRLCVKGRYGFDNTRHEDRLTTPLIRKQEMPKQTDGYETPLEQFRKASWDEALGLAAKTFKQIKDDHGPSSLAGFGSAKGSNEEAYLFQKLIRAGFGTNNVDHCTRLCQASSVAALMETMGSGAASNVFHDVLLAECAIVIGSNTTENHPVAATFIKRARKNGMKLIVIDVRKIDLVKHSDLFLQFRPGTDVALLNGMMHVVLRDGLEDGAFIGSRSENFPALQQTIKHYTPEVVEKITGVPASLIVSAARTYGKAKHAIIFWGMGISQHTTGTDNARSLVNLCLLTGNIGRPGAGLHPLRGQNNDQGASDAGLIPMFYPGYQPVENSEVRERFERAWKTSLDPHNGLTVVEVMNEVLSKNIRAMYMMGENPFQSDPNINKVKKALVNMEFLCVQDLFLTETAEYADVVLPASAFPEKTGTYTNTDRRVQLGRPAIEPPGEARQDWKIICEISNRMGYPMEYASESEVFDEFTLLTPAYAGIDYQRLQNNATLWPCPRPDHAGTSVLFTRDFPTSSGLARFSPAEFVPPKELPDKTYPFVLNTGRNLYHWHTGTMTRRTKALNALNPRAYVEVCEKDLKALGIVDGERVRLVSRRGEVQCCVKASSRQNEGSVFLPFHYKEAAANLLTIDKLDPYGKIPEFKCCAIRIERI